MLSLILGFVTGLAGPISSAVSKITDLKMAKVQADNDQAKLKIDQQIQEAEARKSVLMAEAGNRIAGTINASVRLLLTLGPALLLLKVFAWDKVIGSFDGCAGPGALNRPDCLVYRTDGLDANLWGVVMAVIGFYFVYDLSTRILRK